jgi:hypothetical protein
LIRNRFRRQDDIYCQYCQQSTLFNDPQNPNRSKLPEGTRQYREQYINNQNDNSINERRISDRENEFSNDSFVTQSLTPFEFGLSTTSFASPSTTSLIPMGNVPHTLPPRSLSNIPARPHRSFLVRAYSRQIQPI